MLFRKKLPRDCRYCTHGTIFNNEQVLCVKRGVVSAEKPCRKFTYDPCKRIPPKPKALPLDQYDQTDFSL